ncbi:MAG: hypothetical protein CVU18_13375 [Betaproteobacteria bacterium HGW-Betaproteobacteria-12]|nr:MAG: hypothetical protein CVU18_13375 [Betaproteobacteria bacterium HGW-Betaproteobacteria-12]
MRKFLTTPSLRPSHQARRRSLSRPLLALVAVLACTPLAAGEIGDNARANATSTDAAAIPWMSGGIGDEARDEMRRHAADYNVLIVFSGRDGSYLAGVPFTVAGRDGRQLLAGVSEGPLLYLRLPAASYRISAQIDGAWQGRPIRAGGGAPLTRLSFVSRNSQ